MSTAAFRPLSVSNPQWTHLNVLPLRMGLGLGPLHFEHMRVVSLGSTRTIEIPAHSTLYPTILMSVSQLDSV